MYLSGAASTPIGWVIPFKPTDLISSGSDVDREYSRDFAALNLDAGRDRRLVQDECNLGPDEPQCLEVGWRPPNVERASCFQADLR
jgi:hypothetical protein